MTTQSTINSISRSPWRRGLPRKQQLPRTQAIWIMRGFLLIPLALAWFALSPTVRAVTPAPDGGYAGDNTAEGFDALFSLDTSQGFFNTAIGFDALYFNTTGFENTATGSQALLNNTTGGANTATGSSALFSNMDGSDNTATGFHALLSNTTINGVSGFFNTATGAETLVNNTIGFDNTATGGSALTSNMDGSDNTATGSGALINNIDANNNTATGADALFNNIDASDNTATGADALFNNTTGGANTATGYDALFSNQRGNSNTANGFQALYHNTGSSNIGVGSSAGLNLTTGSNNIDIGALGQANDSNTIRIGRSGVQTSAYMQGISGATVASGATVIVGSNGHLGTIVSSARFKDAIKPMDKASEAILALKPVTFHYKKELDPEGIPQFGLVAEQVERVNPDLVARDDHGKAYTVRYEAVNAMLLNEFLKAHRQLEEQKTINGMLESKLVRQEKEIEALAAGLQKVTDQLDLTKPALRVVANNE